VSKTITVEELAASDVRPTKPRSIKIVRHDPTLRLQDFKPGARTKRLDYDAVQWLIDEREQARSGKKYGL
jgi:hypothetical protein